MKQNPYACGDGGCVLLVPGVPVGMHTNAGCRCIPLKMTPNERVRLRKGIRWLAERCGEVNAKMDNLRSIADEKAAEAGLYARRMEQAQKARGGIRSRLVGEGWVGPDKWSYCPYCGVEAPRPGLHKQGCPAHDKGGSQ